MTLNSISTHRKVSGALPYLWFSLATLLACGGDDGFAPTADAAPTTSCLNLACGEHSTCDDTAGAPACVCDAGYALDEAAGSCVDMDECVSTDHGCDLRCENTAGSYQCALPQTCVDIRTMMPGSPDGEYQLFVHGDSDKPWTAYCHDMTGAPREFLTLVATGPDKNFGQASTGGAWSGDNVRTTYARIRLHPDDLTVDTTIRTFASTTGHITHSSGEVTNANYATALGCASIENGRANIDLTGTPFFVASDFCRDGWYPLMTVTFDADQQVVDLTGGGACGWVEPCALLVLGYLGISP